MSLRTRLVLALFAGPVAAAADLLLLYILVYRAHLTGSKLALHLVTLVSLVVALAGAFYAYRAMRREADHDDHFLATMGAVLGAFFALLIITFELPTSILSPHD